jgi:hypothetical protein
MQKKHRQCLRKAENNPDPFGFAKLPKEGQSGNEMLGIRQNALR